MNAQATEWFNEVYNKHYNLVLNYLTGKVSGREIAEDLTQDVFMKIASNQGDKLGYNPEKSKVNTWVFNYVRNTLTDYYRTDKSSNNTNVDGFMGEDGKETFEHVSEYKQGGIEEREIYRAVRRTMRHSLTDTERKIANLYFLQDLKYKEVAQVLDISMGTVKGLISRIKVKMQEKLMPLYV